MKTFLNCVTIAGVLLSMFSCSREDMSKPEDSQIIVIANCWSITFAVSNSDVVSIDWGDGTPKKEVPGLLDINYYAMYGHLYPDSIEYKITLAGNIVALNCFIGNVTSLNLSKNPQLRTLICSDKLLTSLDVSKNLALTYIDCRNNQLSADALNNFFYTLHSNPEYKVIYIKDNPGTSDCNLQIAMDKGWMIQ